MSAKSTKEYAVATFGRLIKLVYTKKERDERPKQENYSSIFPNTIVTDRSGNAFRFDNQQQMMEAARSKQQYQQVLLQQQQQQTATDAALAARQQSAMSQQLNMSPGMYYTPRLMASQVRCKRCQRRTDRGVNCWECSGTNIQPIPFSEVQRGGRGPLEW